MTITINLSAEVESKIQAHAQELGITPEELLIRLVEQHYGIDNATQNSGDAKQTKSTDK